MSRAPQCAAVAPGLTFGQDVVVVLARIDRAASRHTRHPRHLHPPLDLKYVEAGLAARGIRTALVDGWLAAFDAQRFAAQLLAVAPRVAVLKAVSWCLDESVAVARRLRAAGIVTVAVGQQVRHALIQPPAGWDEAFDLWLDGEPEEALPPLLECLLAGTPPAALRAAMAAPALVRHPDALAVPRHSAAELAAYPFPLPWRGRLPARWGYVLTAWGCPRPCTHCTAIVRKSVGRPLRPRAVAAVADEVAALADSGAEAIAFEDDSLFVHRARFLELAETLARRGIRLPWLANARPDEIDAEVAAAARATGARLIKIGIDSASPRLIEAIGKSRDGVGWVAASRAATALLDAHGIGTVALFVVGLPGETSTDAQASLDLALALPADYLQVQLYRPYPDVELWQALPAAQRVVADEYHYGKPQTQCSAMGDAELAAWPGRFYRRFYLRPAYVARHLRHAWRAYLGGACAAPFAAARFVLRRA